MIRSPLWMLLLSLVLPVGAAGDVPLPGARVELLASSRWFPLSYSGNLETVDLDGDGDLDVVQLPTDSIYDPHAYWLENLGGRSFAPLRMVAVGRELVNAYLHSGSVADVTGDGRPEFLINRQSEALAEPVVVTPTLAGRVPAPGAVTALLPGAEGGWQAVDLDGDGRMELIRTRWVEDEGSTLWIYDRQAGGSFTESAMMELDYDGISGKAEAVDLDGDGDLELSFAGGDTRVVLERTGPRAFNPEPLVFEDFYGGYPWMDLNGDGLPDLLNSDGSWRENVLENPGEPAFDYGEEWPVFPLADGTPLWAVTPRAGQAALMHAVVVTEAGGYELVTSPFDTNEPIARQALAVRADGNPSFLRLTDLDGDGLLDLLYNYNNAQSAAESAYVLAVEWGAAAGPVPAAQVLHAAPGYRHEVIAGDFNRDKGMDLITGPDALGHYRLRFNGGKAGPGAEFLLDGLEIPGLRLEVIGAARIDKDKVLDLLCEYSKVTGAVTEHALVVVRGRKDGSFYKPVLPEGGLVFTPYGAGEGCEFVDWDRDGDLDLVGGGMWRENVKGSFPPGQRFLVELGRATDLLGNSKTIGGTVTGDLDGDRRPDIISLVWGTAGPVLGGGLSGTLPGKMLVAFSDGRGGIEETVEVPIQLAARDFLGNPVTGTAVVADLNADKLPDLWIQEYRQTDFLGNPVATCRWLRNPGRGSRNVAEWVSQPLAGPVQPGLSLADFDGDRKLEWVSATGFLKPTKQGPLVSEPYDFTGDVLLSNRGAEFVAGVDFDADGDVDFVIGGEETPLLVLYNPSADHLKKRAVKVKAVKWVEAVR